MFGSIGVPELLVVLWIAVLTVAPVAVLIFAAVWAYRHITAIHSAQEEIRERLRAIEEKISRGAP